MHRSLIVPNDLTTHSPLFTPLWLRQAFDTNADAAGKKGRLRIATNMTKISQLQYRNNMSTTYPPCYVNQEIL